MNKANVNVEVTICIKGDVPEDVGKKLAKDISAAIQSVVDRAKAEAKVETTISDEEMDEPLFSDRQGKLLKLLEDGDAPEEAIAAIKRGDPIMDRYGATTDCNCQFCKEMREMNDDLPSIIYMLEAIAKENPCDGMSGVYHLSQDDIQSNVPAGHLYVILRYIALNPNWDSDGETMYYKPVPEKAGKE